MRTRVAYVCGSPRSVRRAYLRAVPPYVEIRSACHGSKGRPINSFRRHIYGCVYYEAHSGACCAHGNYYCTQYHSSEVWANPCSSRKARVRTCYIQYTSAIILEVATIRWRESLVRGLNIQRYSITNLLRLLSYSKYYYNSTINIIF